MRLTEADLAFFESNVSGREPLLIAEVRASWAERDNLRDSCGTCEHCERYDAPGVEPPESITCAYCWQAAIDRWVKERDALMAERDTALERIGDLEAEVRVIHSDKDAAIAEVERLRAALRPFADIVRPGIAETALNELQYARAKDCIAAKAALERRTR